jgi:anaerobic magnesium-protoporphyrin IX monomethyl ester cyclase
MAIDILLANPVFLKQNQAERELMNPYFPLGLLYLAAFIRERGFSVEIFDGTFTEGPQDFEAALEEYQPKVVGITAVKPNRQMALKLASLAHARGAKVILGGPDPTSAPATYLAAPEVDLVVHHEGELTLIELLQKFKKDQEFRALDGIAYRAENGEARINPRRQFILNLDELPMPARDMIDMHNYLDVWRQHNGYASMTISVARGCPFGCEWCQDAVHGDEFRQRSPESVVAEVKALMQFYQIDRLRLVDDVDGIEQAWLEEWAQLAEAEGAVIPFEALNDLQRQDVPMLDVRDSL